MYESISMRSSKKSEERILSIPEDQSFDNYFRKRAEYYFFKMAASQITDQQMRVQFSKDILTMFLASVHTNAVSQEYIQNMEQNLQENITFLKTLYPQPKMAKLNRQILQGINTLDDTDKVQFDLLANMGFSYQIKNKETPRTDILSQTEIVFNELIKSSEKTLYQFTNLLMNLIPKKLSSSDRANYERLTKQPWKFNLESDIAKTYEYRKDLVEEKLYFPSVELFRIINRWTQHLQEIIEDPAKYINETENLKINNGKIENARLKNQKKQAKIFNKFPAPPGSLVFSLNSENVQAQTIMKNKKKEEQSQNQCFLFRICNKIKQFCQGNPEEEGLDKMDAQYTYEGYSQSTFKNAQLEPAIQNVEKFGNYKYKESGYLLNNYLESLQQINQEANYKKFCSDQREFLRKGYIQTIRIVNKNKMKQKYTMEEKKLYSFCQNAYYFMEEIVLQRLIKLIQTFLKLKEKSQNQYQKCMVFQHVELIKFNEKNVISAFIKADQKLLKQIYKAILDLTKQRQCKIAKVTNRLETFNNDALIVLKIKNNPILCQLRLILQSQQAGPQSKQIALGQMNAFLNEIQKSVYGPISFLALILATKDRRISYLQSIKKQPLRKNVKLSQICHCGKGNVSQRSSVNTFEKQVKGIITPEGYIKIDAYRNLIPPSFVCGVCQKVIKKGQCVIPVPSCSQCGFHICIECSFENDPQKQKTIYVSLINSIARTVDPCYISQLQLSDVTKKKYNHTYTKNAQALSNGKTQVKKQIHYHIILEGTNFVRYGKLSSVEDFWMGVKQKMNLRNIQEYKQVIKTQKFVGILFRPRQLMHEKGVPFIFLAYDTASNAYSKYVYKGGSETANTTTISLNDIHVSENDVFIPILWLFGQILVTQYITKVLQTNPFCVKKTIMNDPSVDHIRLSRSRISHHHIM